MPKARVETVTASELGPNFERVSREVGERGTTKYAEYDRPLLGYFKEFVIALEEAAAEGEESALARVHRLFVNSLDREAAAKIYESLAAESTEITVGKEKRELMDFPVESLIAAINGYMGQRQLRLMMMNLPADATPAQREEAEKTVDKSIGFGPWRVAAKKLTKGYEKADGTVVAPQAVVNEAAGGILTAI